VGETCTGPWSSTITYYGYHTQCPMGQCDQTTGKCGTASPCQYDSECGKFGNCVGASSGSGVCRKICSDWKKEVENSPGTFSECGLMGDAANLYCDTTLESCLPRSALGGPCNLDDGCVETGFCKESVCLARYAEGEDCYRHAQCEGHNPDLDNYDTDNYICDGVSDFADLDNPESGDVGVCSCAAGFMCQITCPPLFTRFCPGKILLVMVVLGGLACICFTTIALVCAAQSSKPHGTEPTAGSVEVGVFSLVGKAGKGPAKRPPFKFVTPVNPFPCCGPHAPKGDEWEAAAAGAEALFNDITGIVESANKTGFCPKYPELGSVKECLEKEWMSKLNAHLAPHHFEAHIHKPKGKILVLGIWSKPEDSILVVPAADPKP